MSDVLVTVVCITYNHEQYIRDALEGFLSQKTDFPYKIVIHDDASTDGTTKIVEEYKQKKYREIIQSKRNVRLYHSRYGTLRTILLFVRAVIQPWRRHEGHLCHSLKIDAY